MTDRSLGDAKYRPVLHKLELIVFQEKGGKNVSEKKKIPEGTVTPPVPETKEAGAGSYGAGSYGEKPHGAGGYGEKAHGAGSYGAEKKEEKSESAEQE